MFYDPNARPAGRARSAAASGTTITGPADTAASRATTSGSARTSATRTTTTTPPSPRPGSPRTSASPADRSRRSTTSRSGGPSRDVRLVVAGAAAVGVHPELPRHRRLRGRLHLPRHAHRAGLGWLDVRGADAGRVRPGGDGRRAPGASTTRCTSGPSASTASTTPSTATGASRRRSNPAGGYREYGVDALGLNPDGYFSDEEKTNYDAGFGSCRPATNPNPTYGDGVVTPHASFLAMMFEPARRTPTCRHRAPTCGPTARAASSTRSP